MNAERSRNRGVTLIATLVILILYAGFAGVLQARVMASVQVGAAVVQGLEDETNLASLRAVLLPQIAEAVLVAQEGGSPELRLDGTANAWSHKGQSYEVKVSPVSATRTWELLLRRSE